MEKQFVFASFVVLISICMKILLIPSYTSTDFEVHRNWLAVTYNFPHQHWYFENTSEWTLDYPPFFAWFEKGLSQVAVKVDAKIVDINNLNYKSNNTLFFQRGSVITSDLLLAYAAYKCADSILITPLNEKILFFSLLVLNCGLFIVDHIHFQYNGFLFGMLFLSIANIMQNSYYIGAVWFAVLLNFKHIFLYIAPAFGVFFLRKYCVKSFSSFFEIIKGIRFSRIFSFAFIVLSVFCLSFGPFFTDLNQVLKRLFPFKRGLTHAYWAPNFWALYNVIDRVLAVMGRRLGVVSAYKTASLTGGLVQTVSHVVLPSIPPSFTFVLTFLSMVPCLFNLFFKLKSSAKDQFNQFLRAIVLCSLCSFMFGWHVHEKAILMAILPSTLMAFTGTKKDAQIFLFLQTVGHYSLFPLLFTQFETVTKICFLLFYTIFAFSTFDRMFKATSKSFPCLNLIESVYLLGLFFIESFVLTCPFIPILKHYEFLPLLLVSTYCALGITWSWISLYKHVLTC